MRRFLFIILAILPVLHLWRVVSYTQITGKISGVASLPDSANREGIYVTVPGQNKSTVTDAEGNFTINNITAGKIRIQAGKLGYRNTAVDTVLNNGDNLFINMGLGSDVRDTSAAVQTPRFLTSVTNEGNIGAVNKFIDSNETGFKWDGFQQLREASLMIGLDSTRVSDAARFILGIAQNNLDHDFHSLSDLVVRTSGPDSTVVITSFDDSRSNFPPGVPSKPLGINVIQESYAFMDSQNNGALLIKLRINNETSVALENMLVGYFVDWDIQPTPSNNRGDIIKSLNQIHGVNNDIPFLAEIALQRNATSGTKYFGIVPLSQAQFKAARIASIDQEIAPSAPNGGLSEANKYIYMRDRRGGYDTTDLGIEENLCTVVSLGGTSDLSFGSSFFTLPPYSPITVGFAFIGGDDSLQAVNNALQAQNKWIELGNTIDVITDLNENSFSPPSFSISQNYPNPFNPITTLKYQLPVDSRVTLRIYNVLGQVVKELVDEVQEVGYKEIKWDASNAASGVYFYMMEALSTGDPGKTFMQVKKMVLLK